MKLSRMLLAVTAVAVLAGFAYVNQATESSGVKMATAAEKFLGTLTPEQKAQATFAADDKERLNWHFVPLQDKDKKSTRKGLPLESMKPEQRAAALALLKSGTSATGYVQATTIMSLEAILKDLEKSGTNVRNPDWYFFTVFGTPSKTGKWAWRVEGHHLALNFLVDKGLVVSETPAFFGANPAVYIAGDKKGQKVLPEAEDLARELFSSLDADQKKVAMQDKHYAEVEGKAVKAKVGEPAGLAVAKMTDKQKATLQKLVEAYANRMPPDVAAVELGRVKEAGFDKITFGYSGATEPGKPYTYRVHGPTFVIEFLNVQADSAGNPANHIHSAWRNLKGDFGIEGN